MLRTTFYTTDRNGEEEKIIEGEDLYIPPIGTQMIFDWVPEPVSKTCGVRHGAEVRLVVKAIYTKVFIAGMQGNVSQHAWVHLVPWNKEILQDC